MSVDSIRHVPRDSRIRDSCVTYCQWCVLAIGHVITATTETMHSAAAAAAVGNLVRKMCTDQGWWWCIYNWKSNHQHSTSSTHSGLPVDIYSYGILYRTANAICILYKFIVGDNVVCSIRINICVHIRCIID